MERTLKWHGREHIPGPMFIVKCLQLPGNLDPTCGKGKDLAKWPWESLSDLSVQWQGGGDCKVQKFDYPRALAHWLSRFANTLLQPESWMIYEDVGTTHWMGSVAVWGTSLAIFMFFLITRLTPHTVTKLDSSSRWTGNICLPPLHYDNTQTINTDETHSKQ